MSPQKQSDTKKSRGRPATGKGSQLQVRLHDDLLDPLDKFASDEPDAPTRAEAIRRILKDWLSGNGYIKVVAND